MCKNNMLRNKYILVLFRFFVSQLTVSLFFSRLSTVVFFPFGTLHKDSSEISFFAISLQNVCEKACNISA